MKSTLRIALFIGLLTGFGYSVTITVGDSIKQNTTWDADIVEVESDLRLVRDVKLIINPGT
ncbi:MAG: hypothetical protein GY869_09810, partial [Planctomycetes bacterium]|nr:hypothetical protein [Planctomycetota bacterium]